MSVKKPKAFIVKKAKTEQPVETTETKPEVKAPEATTEEKTIEKPRIEDGVRSLYSQ